LLFGIGLINGTARRNTILSILVARVTTFPLAALLSLIVYSGLGLVLS
jgi:phosphate/sulfate permease